MNNKKKISALILLASMLIPYSTAIASPNSGLTNVIMESQSSISDEGGDVNFTIEGSDLVENDIKAYVIAKSDEFNTNAKRFSNIEKTIKFSSETKSDTNKKKLTLTFPKNEYKQSVEYLVRFSVDGSEKSIARDQQRTVKVRKNPSGIDKPSEKKESQEEFEVTKFTNKETTTKGKYDFTVEGKRLDTNKLKVKVSYEFEMNGKKFFTQDDKLTNSVKLSKGGENIKFTIDFPTNEDKKYKVELFNGYTKLDTNLIIEVKKSNIEKPVTPTQETTLNSVNYIKDGLKYTFSIKGTNLDIDKIKVKKVILKENGRPINQSDLVDKIKLEKVSDKELKATLVFPETKEDKEYKVSFGLDQADKKTVACKVTKDDKAPKEEETITPLNPTTTKGEITKVSLIGVNESYQASFTITGLNLSNDNMKVKVLEGMKERTDIEKTFENLATKTTAYPSLKFTEADKGKTFKVYFNADASDNFKEENSVSFKVESKSNLDPDPTVDPNVKPEKGDMEITELKANNPSLDKNGGIAKVTVKGKNLDSKNLKAEIYKLVNKKEEKIDKKVEFIGTDTLQSASITFEKVEKEETYIVKLNDKSCKITVGGKKSLDTVAVVPDVCYLNNQKNKITVKLFAPVTLTVSEKEFKDAITIDSKKLTDEDKVSLLGKNIIIELKNELTVKANSKIEFKERLFKNENNEENKAFYALIQNAIPYGSSLEFVEGQVLSKSGGKVKLKFTGENLKDNVKVKVLKSDKQRTKVATTEDGGGVTVIKKNDNEQEISFNLPENKGKISESYTILVSVDGGRKYMSDYGANVLKSEKEKTTVATVLADETINNKPTLSFMSITSYGTEGGGTNEPDITITHTPVGQASKKTWISLYGANLDEGLTKVKVIDQNGVEWYPIENEGTTDSMDNFLMVMKNNKGRFGIFGDGTSQKIELICPRNIKVMGKEATSPIYKILVAVDGINYNQEITVTAIITDDGDPGKEILSKDNIKEVSVSYETENGKKIIESKKVKGYEWSKLRSFNIRAVEKDGYKLQGVKINDNNELKPISFLNEAKIYDSSSKTLIKNVKFIYEKTKKDNENPTTTPSINSNHNTNVDNTSSDNNENLKDTIKFILGKNQKIKLNSNENLIFEMDANVKDFINAYVDEHLVDKSMYTVKKGSTIITFNKEFIKTLKEGSHDIKFKFKNGLAKTKLIVEKNKSKVPLEKKEEKEKNKEQQNLPKTSITLTNVLTSLILSSVGVFTSLKKSK
jgi:hypothetical protein